MSETYDAGILNDHGGGNVEWWHDYIRAELERSHDFYAATIAALREENQSLLDCLNGSSKAVYTAEMYDALRTRVEELERDRLALSDDNARLNEALGEAEAKVEKVSILARNCICRELVVGGQNRLCAIMLKENHDEMKRHLTGEGK